MTCAWQEFLSILPIRMREDVDSIGKDTLQELRLRINAPPELVMESGSCWLKEPVQKGELDYVIYTATRYSPWCVDTLAEGFITAPGGHRIGVCGEAVNKDGRIHGMRNIYSICIRVARVFPEFGKELGKLPGSVIILGAPGWGKTTLLRTVIQEIGTKEHICVVDERCEIFPVGYQKSRCTDVLFGCSKKEGLEMMLRTMGPSCIAVDEITSENDVAAVLHAYGCGVRLWATAHADCMESYLKRRVYTPLIENKIFQFAVILQKDKSYHVERVVE